MRYAERVHCVNTLPNALFRKGLMLQPAQSRSMPRTVAATYAVPEALEEMHELACACERARVNEAC
eukprot:7695810-Lingulodinium_polyedra.AAC.1